MEEPQLIIVSKEMKGKKRQQIEEAKPSAKIVKEPLVEQKETIERQNNR